MEKVFYNKKIIFTTDSFFRANLTEKDNKRTLNFSLLESIQTVKRSKEN